jgi:hypothetical protein
MKALIGLGPAVLALVALSPHAAAAQGAAGRWEGVVHVPDRPIPVVVDIADDGHGAWTGSATFTGFDLQGTPLVGVSVQGADVLFSVKGVLGDARFEGRLKGPDAIEGHFLEGGNTASFELARRGPPQVEPGRKGSPVSASLLGEWKGEGSLSGNAVKVTLALENPPSGPGTARFVVVGHREHVLSVDLVLDENGFLTVHSPDLGGVRYEGQLKAKDGELVGTLIQGPYEGALVLRKVARP